MSQHTRTRGLIIISVLLTAVIVLGLVFYPNNELEYEISTTETVETVAQDFALLPLEQARELATANAPSHRFVDIRSSDQYSKGHLPNAINIPVHKLLNPSTLEQFREQELTFVLYGDNITDGSAACALLHQLGLTNIQALQGCFGTYSSGTASPMAEAARYDYRQVFEEVGIEERGNLSTPPPPKRPPS